MTPECLLEKITPLLADGPLLTTTRAITRVAGASESHISRLLAVLDAGGKIYFSRVGPNALIALSPLPEREANSVWTGSILL